MASNQPPPDFPLQLDADARPLNGGLQTSQSEKSLELGMSPDMHGIRFESQAIRKDFGFQPLGEIAPGSILALTEHVITEEKSDGSLDYVVYPIRIYRDTASKAVVQAYYNGQWNQVVVSTEPISTTAEFLSVISIQNVLLVADGENPIMAWVYNRQTAQKITDTFTLGNPATEAGDEITGTISDFTGTDTDYVISYKIENVNLSTVRTLLLDLAFYQDNNLIPGSEITVSVVGDEDRTFVITERFPVGTEIKLKVEAVRFPPNDASRRSYQMFPRLTGLTTDNKYWVNYADVPLASQPPARRQVFLDVSFVREDVRAPIDFQVQIRDSSLGGRVIVLGTYTWQLGDPTSFTLDYNVPVTETLLDTDRFEVFGTPQRPGDEFYINDAIAYYYEGTATFEVNGVDIVYDTYTGAPSQELKQITPANFPDPDDYVTAPAPRAKYLGAFGDRAFALWDNGDQQIFSASGDGYVLSWYDPATIDTLGYTAALIDSRIDPIDPLIWLKPVGSQVAILARTRSMMRVYETGNPAIPVGVTHWRDGLGSEYPYGVAQVNGGLMFLGSDRMVYYMTADQIISVGEPIQEELIKELNKSTEYVQCTYDTVFEEFFLGVNANGARNVNTLYIFDLGTFLRTQQKVWRRRYLNFKKITSVSLVTNLNTDVAGGNLDG